MKRYIALVLVCTLALAALPAFAEEVPSVAGDWYARVDGIPYQLTLDPGGAYTFTDPRTEPETGAWEFRDGYIFLNGSAEPVLYTLEDVLCLGSTSVFFTREKPEGYTPAELMDGVPLTMFAGYWKSAYADLNGVVLPAAAMGDAADLYIDGHSAILGGPVLGDTQVKLEFRDGVLSCESDGLSASILYQRDGYLRLTVTFNGGDSRTWYMASGDSPFLDGKSEEAP